MKKATLLLTALFLGAVSIFAQQFDDYFEDKTLRLDYIFAGNSATQEIFFQEASSTPQWAGRRHHLNQPLLKGNGQITVRDPQSRQVIYANSFSSLFQEWQSTEEATQVKKAFENCFQVPYPKQTVEVTISLHYIHGSVSASLTHTISPDDILIREKSSSVTWEYLHIGGEPQNCIDIAILAEGYTANDQEKFHDDARRACGFLLGHEPFKSMANKFNIIAVSAESAERGVSVPRKDTWKKTAASAHYDTFYSDRYLMTTNMQDIYDQLAGVPFEHIIVLANTSLYGGGGIYNSINVTTSDHPTARQVLVHEFGHSFGGLGDEYFYDDQYSSMYPADTEPWEPNLTTLVDFSSKWADMMDKKTAVPTPPIKYKDYNARNTFTFLQLNEKQQHALIHTVGAYEGGGYQSKGVYRPAMECRMKINEVEEFCPVCTRALIKMIEYYTE